MLFNKGFDLSLLLLLLEDKKNKDYIINFIKIIPDEFYIYLCNEINKLELDYKNGCIVDTKNYFLNDGFMYRISSKINDSRMELKLHRVEFDGNIEESYGLSLLYLDDDKLLDNFNECLEFGKFSYGLVEYNKENYSCKKKIVENKYFLKKHKNDKLYVYSKNDIFKIGVEIDLSKILDDMKNEDFNKDILVRKRV